MSKKSIFIICAVLAILAAAGAAYYFYGMSAGSSGSSVAAASGTTLPPDAVTAADHVLGSATAPVTVIEYFAQACSVCSRFDQDVFPLLKTKYIDTGKVRYVMRIYPLFPVDGPAYKLDICLPPDHFFQAVDLLFRNQPQWDSGEYPVLDTHGGLIRMARIMGLTADQADACMNSKKYDDAINKSTQDANTRYQLDATGTPTFVLDFKKADGLFDPRDLGGSWQRVQAAIDTELAARAAK